MTTVRSIGASPGLAENQLLIQNARLEKTLIRIQTFMESIKSVKANFPVAKIIADEIQNIILQADSENDDPGIAPEEITNP